MPVVQRTLDDVRRRMATKQIEVTERLTFWVEVLAKVVADREKDATDRIVSVHAVAARKGRKGSGQWDGRKLGLTIQEESRLITAVVVFSGNDNDCELVVPARGQQRDHLTRVPPELAADKAMDLSPPAPGARGPPHPGAHPLLQRSQQPDERRGDDTRGVDPEDPLGPANYEQIHQGWERLRRTFEDPNRPMSYRLGAYAQYEQALEWERQGLLQGVEVTEGDARYDITLRTKDDVVKSGGT